MSGGRSRAWPLLALLLFGGCAEPGAEGIDAADLGSGAYALDGRIDGTLPERFGVGRMASAEEISAVDIDIMPDGRGLPAGSGSVADGEAIYQASCAICHGEDLEGTAAAARLVPSPEHPDFPDGTVQASYRTIGNYWPYATTLFDYVRRAMPMDRPGSLTDEQVYAVTAFLLYRNGLIEENAVLDAESLPGVVMPARDRFVVDDRLESDRVR